MMTKIQFKILLATQLSILISLFNNCYGQLNFNPKIASIQTVKNDLILILKNAHLDETLIDFNISSLDQVTHTSFITCTNNNLTIHISSNPEEWSSTFYKTLKSLGFLFPHPREQISPSRSEIFSHCNQKILWKPTLKFRGFHVHTLHPNEWVQGFFQGKIKIATDYIRWLARNEQNLIDINLLRMPITKIKKNLKNITALADQFGIQVGLSLGTAIQQQKSYKLIPLTSLVLGMGEKTFLKNNLKILIKFLKFDFITMDIGTSEFTSVNYQRALDWIEIVNALLQKSHKQLFVKVHVSTNQQRAPYGNFNFLPQFSNHKVGILPHTVMFYGLSDPNAPMYGNQNFLHIKNFMIQQSKIRPTWYYPETSYWIGMDMDVPLLLTDYLLARSEDMKILVNEKIEGQLIFTSGQEMGHWLFDWTVALLADQDSEFNPLTGIKLLKENEDCWQNIISFQNRNFKKNQLIAILSAPNLQDELSSKHRIHKRNTLKDLIKNDLTLFEEIKKLELSAMEKPDLNCVKSNELRTLLQITHDRIDHALNIRMAIQERRDLFKKNYYLTLSNALRIKNIQRMNDYRANFERYPEAKLYERQNNPTSYRFGYLWPASDLRFWEIEEKRVKNNRYGPFYGNFYRFLDILF